MSEVDDWQKVGTPDDDWQRVALADRPAPTAGDAIPEAFLDRVRAGQALGRILSAAGHEAKEGAADQTPTGYSDERLGHMIDIGVFHDPAKGRPGPIQMANEAVLFPIAQAWQSVTGAMNAGIHGAGGAVEQLVTEFGGSQGTANRAKNETINAANWAMIEGGMGRFSRPAATPEGVMDQQVGGLPRPEDFANAGKVLESPHAEANLKRMWSEDGIHPAEAVHDAQNDAFFKHEITNGQELVLKPLRAEGDVYIDGGKAVVSGTPRGDYISNIASGGVEVPTTQELGNAIKSASEGEKKFALASGFTEAQEARMRVLNRRIDEGGVEADVAIAEKKTILDSVPDNGLDLDIADVDSLKRLRTEFGSLEKSSGETQAQYEDGLARVLKRYIAQVIDGDDFAKAVFAKAFQEAKKNGVDTKLLSNETMNRFLGDLSHGDQAFMKEQFQSFSRPKLPKPEEPNVVSMPAEDLEALTETGGKPGSLSAAITPPDMIPLYIQPASPPGRLIASVQQAAETLFDIGRDIQMKLTPMARGSVDSMATVKDYMNSMRRNSWDAARIDEDTMKRFTPEQHARMANAMEEESLSLRLKEPASAREHQGLATLTPEERAFVVEQDNRQQLAWLRLRDLGAVEGDGIAMHYPRMVVGIPKGLDKSSEGALSLTAIGYDLRSKTPFMKQRKHIELEGTEKAIKEKIGMQLAQQGKSVDEIAAALEKVKVVRDIRSVNLATKQLEDAVAGRTLIKNIEDVGKRTGEDVIAEGFKPDNTWFTVDHPVFKKWRPKFEEVDGKIEAVKGADGKPVFEQVPIYVRGDFEGPLRSAMWGSTGETYSAMMALKGKTMGLIMNSPAIHNLVEFGRAFPTMPVRIFKAYFDGNRAKNDPGIMHEAIDSGLVPIGKRFFNQDITGLMETPDLTPGRSWTAKVLAAVPGLFDEAAGVAVKRSIDKAGDFWHNTLLWDRIADLQMGLYTNFRGDMIAKGMDQQTASRVAAHMANRYAGALPKEAMSEAATKVSNFVFFSRSFTFGNLGVMKDMLTGMPKDVLAQIERDAGFGKGSIEGADADVLSSELGAQKGKQDAVKFAKGIAQRKAMMTIGLDVALAYVGNSVLQSAFNVMLGDRTIGEEEHEYWRRTQELMNEARVHPLSLLNPFHVMQSLSATNENEPNRKDRVLVGYAKDGTAIYGRNPVGKIGEEFTGYFGGPLDMLRKKEGTVMRPIMQIFSNDAGFGRKIYDPEADSAAKRMGNVAAIVEHMIGSQLPMGQIKAVGDLVTGDGDKTVNLLQALGPLGGFTFSKGAPGGPEVGVMYASKSRHDFEVAQAMPDIRRQIRRGDTQGAYDRMTELDVPVALQKYYVKTTIDPSLRMSQRAVKDFYLHANPEERAQFDRLRSGRAKPYTGPNMGPLQAEQAPPPP